MFPEPDEDTPSSLPNMLPFELHKPGLATTKACAVSMPVRLAYELLMQIDPKQKSQRLQLSLGELVSYLNPDDKFNWSSQIDYVLRGLTALWWLRFPYDDGNGEVDWIPFLPRSVPNKNSTKDSQITINVSLPAGSQRIICW